MISTNTPLFKLHVVAEHKKDEKGHHFLLSVGWSHSGLFSISFSILSGGRLYTWPELEKLASEMRFSLSP